jgi:hypothetical protein
MSCRLVFDMAPADMPAEAIFDDTFYGAFDFAIASDGDSDAHLFVQIDIIYILYTLVSPVLRRRFRQLH